MMDLKFSWSTALQLKAAPYVLLFFVECPTDTLGKRYSILKYIAGPAIYVSIVKSSRCFESAGLILYDEYKEFRRNFVV